MRKLGDGNRISHLNTKFCNEASTKKQIEIGPFFDVVMVILIQSLTQIVSTVDYGAVNKN